MQEDWRNRIVIDPQAQEQWDKHLVQTFHTHFSDHLQLFQKEQAKILVELFLEAVGYLNKAKSTKLIFLFVIVNIIPKFICDGEILFLDFHTCLDRFSPFYSFLDDFVNLIQIDSCFSNQVVVANQVSVPNLNSKNIWIHILRFWRIKYREFETIVETSNWSTCPVSVSLLGFWCSNNTSDKDIVWLHFDIFVHTIISFPNDNSEFILVKRRWMNFVSWSVDPFFLLNQVNPGLQSSLSSDSKLWIKISQLNRFFLIKMPFFGEVSMLNIEFCIT